MFKESEIKLFIALSSILLIFLLISLVHDGKIGSIGRRDNKVSAFDDVKILARSAYVYDVREKKVLYEKDALVRLPLASLTKVMSAVVASELRAATSTIIIPASAIEAEGDSGLYAGEHWQLGKLLDFSLTSSSNDGIKAVATVLDGENSFIKAMNNKADVLGMKNTYYFNETGLDESSLKGGAYGTARDMATLFSYLLAEHPALLEATQKRELKVSSYQFSHLAKNTDKITNLIPGLLASKTGYTDIAGGNLVIAFDPEIGRPVIISILGSTEDGRFNDMGILVERTLSEISTLSSGE